MDSGKVNNGWVPFVFHWLACWLLCVLGRSDLFLPEFTFVTQNKGPLLKKESSELFSVAHGVDFYCCCKQMHHLYGNSNAVTSQLSLLEYSDAGDMLNARRQFSQQKLDEHRNIKENLRKAYSCIQLWGYEGLRWNKTLGNSRFSKAMSCRHKSFNLLFFILLLLSLTFLYKIPFYFQSLSLSNSSQAA